MNDRWKQLLGIPKAKKLKTLISESPIKTVVYIANRTKKDTRYVRQLLAGPEPTADEVAALSRACQLCGRTDMLELDHILPLCIGGRNEIANRRWLCQSCNRRRPKRG